VLIILVLNDTTLAIEIYQNLMLQIYRKNIFWSGFQYFFQSFSDGSMTSVAW